MTTTEKISELVAKASEELSVAQKRAKSLFDEGSFVEIGGLKNSAGVVTGYGTIDGYLAYVYSQNGPVSVAHAKKIAKIYEMALKMGAPVIGLLDSKGVKLEEGVDAFEAYGMIFSNQASASGVVPQISVIFGDCLATSAVIPMLSDFVIMTEENSRMFMASPSTFEGLDGKATSYAQLGGGKSLGEKSNFIDVVCKNDEEALKKAKELIKLLPANNLEEAVEISRDDLNREDKNLNAIVADDEEAVIDVKAVIKSIVDNGSFFETKENFALDIITGLAKFGGATVGIIANNGNLSVDGCEKAALFVNICDCFNIPLLTLTDIANYDDNVEAEQKGILKNSAKLLYAFKNATVPKVNLIMRNAIGNGYMVMNSKHIGCDIVYAWPTAKVALMQKKAAINIMGISADAFENDANPYNVMEKGYIDDIIVPEYTRKRIIAAFEMLSSKRTGVVGKKHGSVQY